MRAFLLPALAAGGPFLLGWAGIRHVLTGARLLGAGELAAAGAVAAALLAERPAVAAALLGAVGLGFATYLAWLLRFRPGTPCGCTPSDAPAARSDLLRPALLLAGGAAAAAGADALTSVELATVVLAGLALATTVDAAASALEGQP
jgi:hypothetical protein